MSDDDTEVTLAGAPLQRRAPAQLSRGDVVGRYVILSELGSGGMGVVYGAYDPELDRKVAVKLLHEDTHATEAHRRLLREAQAMAKLSHPNVVTVHDVGEHEGRVFLAMEFIEGETLRDWVAREKRDWPEILEVFRQAGQGLSAAHQKGLVHRDFKPDNVMLGKDGRVRVMDFGLARAERDPEGVTTPASNLEDIDQTPGNDALATALTRGGEVLGTPRYLAPERWLGEQADPRADQFSFCVALYEALFGQRAHAGNTPAQLSIEITTGKVRDPPRGKTPGWLRQACLRGLRREPDDRFASMADLLAVLDRGRGRARRTRGLVAMGALVVLAGGVAVYRGIDESQRVAECESAGATIAEVWNESSKASLRQGLVGAGVPYGETTLERVLPYLEAYAATWQDARTELCLDVEVRQTLDPSFTRPVLWCLTERRLALESLVTELSEADAGSVQKAVLAAAGLPRFEPCTDPARLARLPQPPTDDTTVREILGKLAQADARLAAGKYESGLAVAEEALEDARAVEWRPVAAAANFRVGMLREKLGEFGEAESHLRDAYFDASQTGAWDVAADAALELVNDVGNRQKRVDEALVWHRHAETALIQLDEPDDSPRRVAALSYAANVHRVAGEIDEARDLNERALAIRERLLGPRHPDVARLLNNMANLRLDAGDYEAAIALQERAIPIWEEALGPDHPTLATAINNFAAAFEALGDRERARELHARALSIRETALGPEHPDVAGSLNNLGNVYYDGKDYEPARDAYERALSIYLQTVGPTHPYVAMIHNNLAGVHVALGDQDRARAAYEQALVEWEKALGPEHPQLAFPLTGLAQVALNVHDPERAREAAERATRIREANSVPAEQLADSHFELARARWLLARDRDERARAHALVERALEEYQSGEARPRELERLENWLEAHPIE